MPDILGSRTDKGFVRHLTDLNRIVSNKAVTSLDKLKGCFALTHSAFTHYQNTLAVNLDENAVTGDSRRKLNAQI